MAPHGLGQELEGSLGRLQSCVLLSFSAVPGYKFMGFTREKDAIVYREWAPAAT